MKQAKNKIPKIRNGICPDTALWQRIDNFSLDAAGVHFPFSRKLARENNWDPDFTAAAITEYKKFTYLCCILPQGASPPYIVDQVWHMHLIYTENYWEQFCDKILQQKLHHHPSTGGTADRQKHEAWYLDTLAQYRAIFGTEPPPYIWNNPNLRHTHTKSLQRLRPLLRSSSLLLVLLCLSGCGSGSLAVFMIVVFFLFAGLIRTANRNTPNKKQDGTAGSSDGGGGSSGCGGSSCGSGCGGGCGGCGGCGGS